MKITFCLLSFLFLQFQAGAHEVTVPQISSVNVTKRPFMLQVSSISNDLFPNTNRSAIAPFGGVKITPFIELDLQKLVIVTNSYPGTPDQIKKQFMQGSRKLTEVLKNSLSSGSMSTSEVLGVTNAAQLLARLKLELGVKKVEMSYWVSEESKLSLEDDFLDRSMNAEAEPVATVFNFELNSKKATLVFLSSYIRPDSSSMKPGFPTLLTAFIPANGFNWIYLSADGLGHFSANRNNGLNLADGELLDSLEDRGAVLLDYPTDKNYHTSQIYGGITFMNGRLDLAELGLERVKTIKLSQSGIFGYCLQAGDEVRIYRKDSQHLMHTPVKLKQVGSTHQWILN